MSNDPKGDPTGKPISTPSATGEAQARPSHFIRDIILQDIASGKHGGRVHTRFPPEPNGYLHIGHAKSICLNYGLAQEFGGKMNLRFDDTNPCKEETEYVDSIIEDVRWLGADWEDRLFYASDYFQQLYEWAVVLIKKGNAYVCDLTADEVREYRGTLSEPGKESPFRNRSVEENLDLFERMKSGDCLLYTSLGIAAPEFAHLPLLIAPDGAKLSKRKHGPVVSVTTYRDAGFLPEAYINFLCLLGWNPKDDREKMSLQELIDAFTLEGVNRSNAVVNFTEMCIRDRAAAERRAHHADHGTAPQIHAAGHGAG